MTYTLSPPLSLRRAVGRALLLLTVVAALLATAPSASAGPIILSGHDPEDHGTPGDEMQFDILEFVVSQSTRNASPSMVLMLGGSTATELQSILAPLGYTVTHVTGAAIATVSFDPFDAIYMPTSNNDVVGGITPEEVGFVNTRSADIQTFVNEGGGLAAFSQNVPGGYGWFPLGRLDVLEISGMGAVVTPIGMTILSPSATAVEPFHSAFLGPAGFFGLDVLAFQQSTGRALIIGGGSNTQILGQLTLSPDSVTNAVGTMHTVTALLEDQDDNPLVGETIMFEVLSGPNMGDMGSDVTDTNGEASFTYTGDGGEGTDRIRASWDNGTSTVTSNIVTKIWVAGGPGGNVVMEDDDAGDIVNTPAQDASNQAVDQITGTIPDGADEDCYLLTVTDPGSFSAEVVSFDPDGDSQLFLFDENRNGIYGDDDGGDGLLSLIETGEFQAGGGMTGDYYLCISAFNDDPLNSDGAKIFPFGSTLPDPSSGNALLADWDDNGFLTGGPTAYDIRLTGVGPDAAVPNVNLMAEALSPLTGLTPGGAVGFEARAINNTPRQVSGDLWAVVQDEMGNTLGTIGPIASGTFPPNVVLVALFAQAVPTTAPSGQYTYTLKIGTFPSRVVDSESFTVTVGGGTNRSLVALRALLRQAEETGDKSAYLAARQAYLAETARGWDEVTLRQGFVPASDLQASAEAQAGAAGAYPNPFLGSTRIAFALEEEAEVTLVVYDALGREIAVLVDGQLDAGSHSVAFDAAGLPSGVYLWRLNAGSRVQTGQLTLLR